MNIRGVPTAQHRESILFVLQVLGKTFSVAPKTEAGMHSWVINWKVMLDEKWFLPTGVTAVLI